MMEWLFGETGNVLWYIGEGTWILMAFVRRKLRMMLWSLGRSIAKVGYEVAQVRIWMDPKAR